MSTKQYWWHNCPKSHHFAGGPWNLPHKFHLYLIYQNRTQGWPVNLPSVWIPWARRIVIPKAVDISQKIIHLKFLQNATNACSCTDCIESCTPPDFPDVDEDFVIVEGVDGVVFIMVIIFVLGTIIFLAIVAASAALKKNISHCKLFANLVGIIIQNIEDWQHCLNVSVDYFLKWIFKKSFYSIYGWYSASKLVITIKLHHVIVLPRSGFKTRFKSEGFA